MLRDDLEWRRCLEEASLERTPRQMRSLFATIIVFNRPADVYILLTDFSDQLREDLMRDVQEYNIPMDTETYIHSVVVMMEKELEKMDVSNDQVHTVFGEDFVSQDQRTIVMELLADVEEARQKQHDEQRERCQQILFKIIYLIVPCRNSQTE